MPTSKNDLFVTSDWHLYHENVIRFSKRPFTDVHHMTEVLVKRYNSRVGVNSTCYFLGDMGFGKVDWIGDVVHRLNGTKILILGNHDRGRRAMKSVGFDSVMNMSSFNIGKHLVTMSHMPLKGILREDTTGMRGTDGTENWHGENHPRSSLFSLPDFGQFHLHGHIHSPNGGRSEKILGRQMDVGVDANDYYPVPLSQIESWVINTYNKEMSIGK